MNDKQQEQSEELSLAWMELFSTHAAAKRMREKAKRKYSEGNNLYVMGDRMKAQAAGKFIRVSRMRDSMGARGVLRQAEGEVQYSEGRRLCFEGRRLIAVASRTEAEASKLKAEGTRQWAEKVLSIYGDIDMTVTKDGAVTRFQFPDGTAFEWDELGK